MSGDNENDTNEDDTSTNDDAGTETEGSDDNEKDSFKAPKTQADFDRMVRERLKRERQKFAGYEEAKKKAEEFDKLQAANKTAEEKTAEALKAAEEKAAAAQGRVRRSNLRAEVASWSTKLQIIDPDLALLAVEKEVEYDDDDEPIGIEDKLKKLIKEKPHLRGQRFAGSADGGARDSDSDPGSLSMDEYMKRRAGKS